MSTQTGDVKTCSNSEDFPAAWLDNAPLFLHATSEVCCQKTFGGDPSCRVDDRCAELNQVAQDAAARAAAEKAIEDHQVGGETQGGGSSNDCSELKWHMSIQTGDVKTCSNSEDFPTAWLDNAPIFLHATSEVCCQKTFGGDPSCRVDDRFAELNQVAQEEADRAAAEEATEDHQVGGKTQGGGSSNDCSALKWHMSTRMGDVKSCSNSEDFPTAWLDNATIFLHATGEVCCQKMFGGDPSCRVDDRCTELNQVTQDEADQAGGGTQGDGSSND